MKLSGLIILTKSLKYLGLGRLNNYLPEGNKWNVLFVKKNLKERKLIFGVKDFAHSACLI
jgi:hypothetical protein